jgi:hypothetical protein
MMFDLVGERRLHLSKMSVDLFGLHCVRAQFGNLPECVIVGK